MADLMAPLPVLTLRAGATVRFEAIDPATGAAVAGVAISAAHLWAADTSDDSGDEDLAALYLQHRGD